MHLAWRRHHVSIQSYVDIQRTQAVWSRRRSGRSSDIEEKFNYPNKNSCDWLKVRRPRTLAVNTAISSPRIVCVCARMHARLQDNCANTVTCDANKMASVTKRVCYFQAHILPVIRGACQHQEPAPKYRTGLCTCLYAVPANTADQRRYLYIGT